ncbi:uncharacterized protein LOC142345685 [Convolutriloba macropyga]|uniref:uncharacterized protein LOC142345685 n=1 Tax=Convolutriloba macropyga TaxID=536237 RepID=UPI003F526C5F
MDLLYSRSMSLSSLATQFLATIFILSCALTGIETRSQVDPCTFVAISDTTKTGTVNVAKLTCPQSGRLEWMFASGSLSIIVKPNLSLDDSNIQSSSNQMQVCLRAVDQSESGKIFMTINSEKRATSDKFECIELRNGLARVQLDSQFEAFDEKHLFIQYEIRSKK